MSNAAGVIQASEREAKNLTVGAIHMLSKPTRVFGGYQRVSVEGVRNVANTTTTSIAVLATHPIVPPGVWACATISDPL